MPTTPQITRAFQWDLARQVERLDFLLKWLPCYADWGYQELYLHLEDAVEYPSLPGVARRDAYSYRQFTHLVDAATRVGVRVVPIVNLLGHTQYLIKVPELRDLNELRDASGQPLNRGQICPLHPRTMEIAGKLLGDLAPFCTAGKVHVGLDESFHLGRCPRCRADVRRRGLAAHFAGHVRQLHQMTTGMGLRMGMWADMLALLPAAIPLLPRDLIAYDWYYYPFARHPRIELRNFAEVDLATPLQKQGIEYWGCPMNGAFRYEPMPTFGDRLANIRSWWERCRRVGAAGILVTSWEANRLAIELATAVDAAAACLWLDPGVEDPREMLARGFERVFGERPIGTCRAAARRQATHAPGLLEDKQPHTLETRRWARVALACDDFAFAGYHRWQINDRWDVCAGSDGGTSYKNEVRVLEWLQRSLIVGDARHDRLRPGSYQISPPALCASLAFRCYLAQRDVFVRRNAKAVFQLRRQSSAGLRPASSPRRRSETGATFALLQREAATFAAALRAGRAAARAMWNRSRDPRQRGPNELMLNRDKRRLSDWCRWLRKAARDHELIWQATPVCGAWQLQFTVHNFAPAVQKIVVEQQESDGTWQTLHGLHTIEFRAFAARSRADIRRQVSVPIHAAAGASERAAGPFPIVGAQHPSTARRFPLLRLAVDGPGQVGISHVSLTNGVTTLHLCGWPPSRERILGRPAPSRGFPQVSGVRPSRLRLVFASQIDRLS